MAAGDAHVFPGFLTPVLTQLSFQSHRLLFSHASEVRSENTPERKFASTGYRFHNQQVTTEPPGMGARCESDKGTLLSKKKLFSALFFVCMDANGFGQAVYRMRKCKFR